MRSCQNNLYVIYNKNKSAKVFVVQLLALGVIIIKKKEKKKKKTPICVNISL